MAFNKLRIGLLVTTVIGGGLGFALGVMDVGAIAGAIALGFGLVAGLVIYWYYRKYQRTGEIDERYVRIQGRASRWTAGFFFVSVSVVGSVLVFTELTFPVGLTLLGLVFAGILVDELTTELYRRRM